MSAARARSTRRRGSVRIIQEAACSESHKRGQSAATQDVMAGREARPDNAGPVGTGRMTGLVTTFWTGLIVRSRPHSLGSIIRPGEMASAIVSQIQVLPDCPSGRSSQVYPCFRPAWTPRSGIVLTRSDMDDEPDMAPTLTAIPAPIILRFVGRHNYYRYGRMRQVRPGRGQEAPGVMHYITIYNSG